MITRPDARVHVQRAGRIERAPVRRLRLREHFRIGACLRRCVVSCNRRVIFAGTQQSQRGGEHRSADRWGRSSGNHSGHVRILPGAGLCL